MRIIENGCLRNMKSPARHVFRDLHLAIVNIAREKSKAFEQELNDFTLVYVDTHLWELNVNVSTREIHISCKVVEVVWAATYAYFVVYNEIIQHQDRTKQVMVDLTEDEHVHKACRLIQWAFETWLNRSDQEWPDDLPMPGESPSPESDEHVADELALGALAFMLHHELSHIRFGHYGRSTIERERDADYAALDWVFERADYTNEAFINKKALCCAAGLGVLCAHDIYTGKFVGNTHPPSYERLVCGMKRVLGDDDCHLAWFFVTAILRLHMTNKGYVFPEVAYDTPYDCVDAMAEQLSRVVGSDSRHRQI